jgi:hypothetical protein
MSKTVDNYFRTSISVLYSSIDSVQASKIGEIDLKKAIISTMSPNTHYVNLTR